MNFYANSVKVTTLIFLSLVLWGCSREDDALLRSSSSGYDLAGKHLVPAIGKIIGSEKIMNNTLLVDRVVFSTNPVTFGSDRAFAVGSQGGEVLIYSQEDSLRHRVPLQSHSPVIEILTDSSQLFAIQLDGSVSAVSKSGKQLWQSSLGKMPQCNSLFTGERIIIAVDSSLAMMNAKTGAIENTISFTLSPRSIAYDEASKKTFLALSWNTSGGADSILTINASGMIESRIGFPGMRITSNIAIIDAEKMQVAFGYLGEAGQTGSVRKTLLAVYDGITNGKPHQLTKQEVPYIVTSIAANRDVVVSSGFRERENEISSGIDAFALSDFSPRWQRRFTEPIVNPIVISRSLLYVILSFHTQAQTPTSAIFYSLDASSGKTERELGVPGVRNGFAPGPPMARTDHGFLLSDRDAPIIYFLTP